MSFNNSCYIAYDKNNVPKIFSICKENCIKEAHKYIQQKPATHITKKFGLTIKVLKW